MLKIYDQPDALVITDGSVELYLDVNEFADRDDVTPAGNYGVKPDYIKKRTHKAGEVCKYKEIQPRTGMIIIHEMAKANNYTRLDDGSWRRSDDGRIVWDINEHAEFTIVHPGVQ